ncbi:MAG: LmeA family phospholipid-binding protein [Chthonomonadaceae bacterium]|nr:LmeA family phospholipid-binding protein [Chthonomonadaceae bacterium]
MEHKLEIGLLQIIAQNVRLPRSLIVDEVRVDAPSVIAIPPHNGEKLKASAGEQKLRVLITEPNINAVLAVNIPESVPVRNLKVEVMSGKMKVSGHYKIAPFTVDAVPVIENGVRVKIDLSGGKSGMFGMPSAMIGFIESEVNQKMKIDLSLLPFPVQLDAITCEPGRVIITGRAKLSYPLPPALTGSSAFLPK